MIRILSSKRYWNLISMIAEQNNQILDLQGQIKTLKESLDYVNQLNMNKVHKIMKIRSYLARNGIKFDETEIDFPATSKILDDNDINRILKL